MKHFIYKLAKTYPQITLPIKEGISETEEYRNICLRGEDSPYPIDFILSDYDSLDLINTQAGEVNAVSMFEREDFVHMVRSLAYKCEPVDIPASTGAMSIFGLNNWDKVRQGLDDYKDRIIILSSGPYSNVNNKDVFKVTNGEIDLSLDEWRLKSIIIRKYHEITHIVMRKLYPDDIKPLRDELLADMVGLLAAFSKYDDRLAKLFLGLESKDYRIGGRLENYSENYKEEIPRVREMISKLVELCKEKTDYQEVLDNIQEYMKL